MTTSESSEAKRSAEIMDQLKVLKVMDTMRETLAAEIKKLRAARTKLSQAIKVLEAMELTLTLSPEEKTPDPTTVQPKPKLSDHPAIQTYRDVFHTYPQKGVYQLICDNVGDKPEDLEIWRECCTYWMGNGWNPKNINGQLEHYTEEWAKAEVPERGELTMEVIDGVLYRVNPDGTREIAAKPD